MLGLTLCSRSPPPTERMSSASRAERWLVRSQASKTVCQPSSLVRAVSSETLSLGAYASIFASLRKSLTACEALPALPPTPRMNKRPPLSRVCARRCAARSMTSVSSPLTVCANSCKNPALKLTAPPPLSQRLSFQDRHACPRYPLASQSRRSARTLHTPRARPRQEAPRTDLRDRRARPTEPLRA